jgi:hypothetical protein
MARLPKTLNFCGVRSKPELDIDAVLPQDALTQQAFAPPVR